MADLMDHEDGAQAGAACLPALSAAFGGVVATRRAAMGLGQREFARIVGISNSHLRKIESGEVSPRLLTVVKIAEALGVSPEELVGEACRLAKKS